jgi:hypothetical protein
MWPPRLMALLAVRPASQRGARGRGICFYYKKNFVNKYVLCCFMMIYKNKEKQIPKMRQKIKKMSQQ